MKNKSLTILLVAGLLVPAFQCLANDTLQTQASAAQLQNEIDSAWRSLEMYRGTHGVHFEKYKTRLIELYKQQTSDYAKLKHQISHIGVFDENKRQAAEHQLRIDESLETIEGIKAAIENQKQLAVKNRNDSLRLGIIYNHLIELNGRLIFGLQ
ncbi:MAG: hypothetical protein AABY64_09125 [Bdellovibrionota bacterium]